MEIGCLGHPETPTIGSELLDEHCSRSYQILQPSHEYPHQKGRQVPITLINNEEGEESKEGEVENCQSWKMSCHRTTTLTVDAGPLNPRACGIPRHAHALKPLTTKRKLMLFIVNSFELHLTAFKYIQPFLPQSLNP